jgi:hypothetical protein
VPLWLTKTTCSSLSPSSAIEFTGNSIKYKGIQQIKNLKEETSSEMVPLSERPATNTAAKRQSSGSCKTK